MKLIYLNIGKDFEFGGMHGCAFEFSRPYLKTYLEQHENIADGLTGGRVAGLACARLEWILQMTRERISNIFSLEDIKILIEYNKEGIFMPQHFSSIPEFLCDTHGIDFDEYPSSYLKDLVEKLCCLDDMQFFALGDALEQTWRHGMTDETNPGEFLQTLGIELV